jgi:thiol:disulfide interchange protein DsbD
MVLSKLLAEGRLTFPLGEEFKRNVMRFILRTLSHTVLWGTFCALAVFFAGTLSLQAGIEDPFDPANRAEKTALKPAVSPTSKKLAELLSFKIKVTPPEAKPGSLVKLELEGRLKAGYHTYPVTQRAPDQPVGALSKITFQDTSGLKPLWPITETKPTLNKETGQLELEGPFTWSQEILIPTDAKPGPKTLRLGIRLQVCDARGCIGPGDYPAQQAVVKVTEGKPVALAPEIQDRLNDKPPPIKVVNLPGEKSSPTKDPAPAGTQKGKGSIRRKVEPKGLMGLVGGAVIGAILMLLTPCVFPMIPITVNFFLKQSEKEHHRPLPVASVYAGTIIILLTLVMLALGQVVIQWSINPWFNLVLGAVMVLFALSLFGMYEIELPRGLARFTSAYEGQGGYVGALFMALTFTITSFTCTGPFIGAMLGTAAALRPPFGHLVLAVLAYSVTFAAPFFILALFPTLLKALPKSGGWLNAIKVTMGFIELALAMKFLGNADMMWSPGEPRFFTYDSVLCAWIALSFACGLYLIGVFRLPHDEPVEHIGVVRMLFAALFFGLTFYMAPALWGKTPQGIVGENIVIFLPRDFSPTPTSPVATNAGSGQQPAVGELPWHLDYIDGWKESVKKKEPTPIFIDFTGVLCINCNYNEKNIFPKPEVSRELAQYVRVRLFTDSVPDEKLQAEGQAERNAKWQSALGDITNPFYVIFMPNKEKPFDEKGNLNGTVLATESGKIFNVNEFVQFLKNSKKGAVQVTSSK